MSADGRRSLPGHLSEAPGEAKPHRNVRRQSRSILIHSWPFALCPLLFALCPLRLCHDATDEIVLLRAGDQDVHHLTKLRLKTLWNIVDKDTAVNIGRLCFHSSLPQ